MRNMLLEIGNSFTGIIIRTGKKEERNINELKVNQYKVSTLKWKHE